MKLSIYRYYSEFEDELLKASVEDIRAKKVTVRQLAERLDRSIYSIYARYTYLNINVSLDYSGDYALYKGEDILSIGTIDEIAEDIGVKRQTVYKYGTPTYRKFASEENGRRLIKLD